MYRMLVYNPKQLALSLGNQTSQKRQKDGFRQLTGVEHKADTPLIPETGNEVDAHSKSCLRDSLVSVRNRE